MADASLRIPITADASKFLYTLQEVEAKLEGLRESLKTAKGDDIGGFNIEIGKFEQQQKAIENFGKFAKGTFGSLLQQLKDLKAYQLTLSYNGTEFKEVQADIDATKAKIKDLTSTPKEVKIVIPPPEGSIAALEEKLKELKAQRKIQVDYSEILQSNIAIKNVEAELKNLNNIGIEIPAPTIVDDFAENSILGLRKKIDELNAKKIRIGITNEGEISKLNSEIKGLEQEIKKANDLTIDENGGISKNANKARQTITNLKLVAQDLPFGFIAIQNNIPNLLESFGDLNTKSGGLKGTFKELGKQLVGPAGIFLAFSVVTAAVTYAVQKYGSLGNAVDALFGKLDPLYKVVNRTNEAISKFNKDFLTTGEVVAQATGSTESQIIKMKALADVVTDTTKSENVRKFALKEMKGIDEARFGRYDVEKGKLAGLTQSVNAYTQSIIANSVAQKLSDRAADALITRNAALNLYTEQEKSVESLKKKFPDVENGLRRYLAALKLAATTKGVSAFAEPGVAEFMNATGKLDEYRDSLNQLNGVYRNTKKDAKEATDASINLGAALVDLKDDTSKTKNIFVTPLDTRQLDEAYNLDTIISNLTKYGGVLIDVNKSEKERNNAIKELKEINPEYFKSFTLGVTSISDFREKLEALILSIKVEKKEREDAIRVSQLSADFRKQEEKGIESLGDKYNFLGKRISAFPTTMEEINEQIDENVKLTNKFAEKSISPFGNIEKTTEPLKFLQDQLQLAYTAINQVFFNPLQGVFEKFLTTGKITFKDFAKTVGKSIADIAAKLAATGVIQGLLLLLDPSGALAGLGGSFGGGNGGGNGILDALGSVFGRKPKSPNFNGVSGRGSGGEKVEFTIRGTNLVGVLNRANGEINRIG
jgi:hypothetical protein